MRDDTTDKLFPPPESAVVEAPIPIGPSIRQEFVLHRRYIDKQLEEFGKKLDSALERLAPEASPSSALRKVGRGAAAGGRYGAAILAGLGLVQAVVKLWRPELAGPFDSLMQVFGG
jgi:hypothetical protein